MGLFDLIMITDLGQDAMVEIEQEIDDDTYYNNDEHPFGYATVHIDEDGDGTFDSHFFIDEFDGRFDLVAGPNDNGTIEISLDRDSRSEFLEGPYDALLAVRLDGGGGNDTIQGGLLDDTLIGGSGDDHLFGWLGNDLYMLEPVRTGCSTLKASTPFADQRLNWITIR